MPAQRTGADWPTPCVRYSDSQDAEELHRQNHELQERVEGLEAFSRSVAHDLKGSLGSLGGLAGVLRENYVQMSAVQRKACLDHLAYSAHKLSTVVDELLLLAEIHQADVVMKPLNMAVTVAEAQKRLAPMIEDYQAEIVLPDEWPMAEGRDSWVEEVWINYLSNAIKYGGLPPRVELGAGRQPDGTVRFWVRDNGQGLTLNEQARLFKPFTRLENVQTDGHGLGLSVVQHIIKKLGGQVGIESIPGQGSVFSFTLRGCQS